MAALSLHHAVFATEKDSDLPLRSAASFLHPAPERDRSPTSELFASAAYQGLIQRQPTHPDGPRSGWDLGLNLLGDPITAAEHKSSEDHQTKVSLRRLHAVNFVFELLFGIWGTYTTVRYCLASDDGLGDIEHVCALILGILSALSAALVIISISMPLFPQRRLHIWRLTRSLLRACYLLLLSAGAVMNFVLVLIWHPSQLCDWDIDISWYTSAVNTETSPCRTAPFSAWMTAATLRLAVTLTLTISFIFALRSYYGIRHPSSYRSSPKYSPYLQSDPEDISPVSALQLSNSTFRFARSEDSSRTLNQSNTTLPKSNSISTLAPSTSCTGHSHSHSTSPPKDISPPRISPSTSRRTSTHTTNHGPETLSQIPPVNATTTPWSVTRMLRRTSRISITQVPSDSDSMLLDTLLHPERLNGTPGPRDPSEIRSSQSTCKSSHRPTSAHLDLKKPNSGWENLHARDAAQPNDRSESESFSSPHDDGESVAEKDKDDSVLVYSYGYGASDSTYPYLDMYNPQRRERYVETPSSCEETDARAFLSPGSRRVIPTNAGLADTSSEQRSSHSMEDVDDAEEGAYEYEESSGEEEEYVAMMGGFVRRMATIESLGSKEATGTLSTTGSVAPHSVRSKTPVSQFSSVRFAERASTTDGTSSLGMPTSREGSHSTAYLSFSSGSTGMWVNERGELLSGPNAGKSTAGSPSDRRYYTASGSSFPRMDDG